MVDAATFIDPVVPVESERAAGAVVKRGMRSVLLWYVGWITHQISQFASAVSRALHIVDTRLNDLERQVEEQRVPGTGVVEFPGQHGPGAWWAETAVAAVAKVPGRILHAACGDGWLVRLVDKAGGDAYGVDPRAHIIDRAELGVLDLRGEELAGAPARRGAGRPGRARAERPGRRHRRRVERAQLLTLVGTCLAPGGTLVLHSASRQAWDAADAPYEADLSAGRPLRPEAWCRLFESERVRGGGSSWSGGCRLSGDRGAGRRRHALIRPPSDERRRRAARGAGGRAPVRPDARTRTMPRARTRSCCATCCAAAGWRSEIFAEAIHDDLAAEAYKHWMYPDHAAPGDVAIYQFSTSSAVAGYLQERSLPLILDFHNFTGPELFAGWEPHTVRRAALAADELARLAPRAALGLADSPFNERGLRRAGCRNTRWCRCWWTTTASAAAPDRASGRRAGRGESGGGRGYPLRRAHRALEGTARAGQGAVGLPPALRTARRAFIWSVAHRASATSRRCEDSSRTLAWPARCA